MSGYARLKVLVASLTVFLYLFCNAMSVYAVTLQDISGHWAKDSITRLAALEIVNGYNGQFKPSGVVTRAEFAAMMVKAMGYTEQAGVVQGTRTGYSDVPAGHWASGFIIVAKELGMISGYPDNSFRPSAPIRRDEITSVLVRAMGLTPTDDMKDINSVFADGTDIPNWAAGAVKTAYGYKLISGYPDGRFYPGHNATRGETAALIENVLQLLGSEFTFAGKLEKADTSARTMTLNIHGQIESFFYRSGLVVKNGNAYVPVGSLHQSTPVLIIVDEDGYITYVQVAGESGDEADSPVRGDRAAALNYTRMAGAGNSRTGVLVVAKKGQMEKTKAFVQSLGGKVAFANRDIDFISAQIPPQSMPKLAASPLVDEVTLDRTVKVNSLSTAVEDNGLPQADESNPGRSLSVTKEAIKAPEFVGLTQADGKNQTIAIIDTGVDAGHPDLQTTTGGLRKISEWHDFTGQGDIDTSSVMAADGNNLTLVNGNYNVEGIISKSGLFHYGYMREVDLLNADGSGFDLNFNNKKNDIFGVIVADSSARNVYDTVYVDTDGDMDFSDEKPLHQFAKAAEFASFTGNAGRDELNFVLTQITSDGSKINLGFDGNDHGTHVAGIAAANGTIKGVAPGAQIMSLKVLDTAGYGDLSTITEAMTYAAAHGARIINLSLGFPGDGNGGSLPAKLLNNLTERYGVIFVVAAGNDGPGLSTVATPGDATAALSVGAFITPQMWEEEYGWKVPDANLWFFSAVGPRKEGGLSPSVIAPGSVTSTVPKRNGSRYFLSEGTSMAAPHVAGAIALLMEVIQRKGLKASPQVIKKAVEAGAGAIPNYTAAEQGYGAVDLPMSWAEILSLQNTPRIVVQTLEEDSSEGEGIYFREGVPKKLTVKLKNTSSMEAALNLEGGSWMTPAQSTVTIPPQATRSVDVNVNIPDRQGLFAAFISGDDPKLYGKEMEMLATVVNPYELNERNGFSVQIEDNENAAQYKRYFYKVPAGADALNVRLRVPNGTGRTRVFLFDPKGRPAGESGFAGVNPGETTPEVTLSQTSPAAGVWEAVIYTSAGLSAYNLDRSDYTLRVSAMGTIQGDLKQSNRDIIVGVVPKVIRAGGRDFVTVQVRDKFTKHPYQGFVEINGRIYFTRGGRVTMPVECDGTDYDITVRTIPDSLLYRPWEIAFQVPVTQDIFQ